MRIIIAIAIGLALVGCGNDEAPIVDAATDGAITDGSDLDDAPPACAGLDALQCRSTAGCAADFCDSCSCTPTYAGCRLAAEPMAVCPILDCPTPSCCHADTECTGAPCLSPGESPGCGICQPVISECATDAECRLAGAGVGGVLICQPVACACSPANTCVPGCVGVGDCGEAETCDVPNGRCRPSACSVAAPCPDDFDCTGGACMRRACTTDATCDGFCVESLCRDSLGVCTPPPA